MSVDLYKAAHESIEEIIIKMPPKNTTKGKKPKFIIIDDVIEEDE